jgi:hypothetical protein
LKTKLLYLTFIIILFLFSNHAYTQIPNEVKTAFNKGNSQQLANYFNKSIELLINQKEEVYSKAQAELIIKDFFNKHEPDTFKIENEGVSDGINYSIGILLTTNGKFRIYIGFGKYSGRSYINRINISEYR